MLEPLPQAKRSADLQANATAYGVPQRIGVGRSVAATADAAGARRHLQWRTGNDGGQAAAVSFVSPGASGVRLGLLVHALPEGATVRGYVQGGNTAFAVSAADVLATIARNRDAGDVSDSGRTYWSPPIEGDELTIEIALPPGASPDTVMVSFPQLSHLYVSPRADVIQAKIGGSASCEVDVSCTSYADTLGRSVARMIFVNGGYSYTCTGTLLNDAAASGTPYLLSANHCISTQTAASSLVTNWFYRSTACNSGTLNSSDTRQLSGGATLLYASGETDTSFLRLNTAVPAGASFAAWSSAGPNVGMDAVGVHHPKADLMKYAQGSITTFLNCTGATEGGFSCSGTAGTGGNFVNARWSTGEVESGSSGSGLFAAIGGGRYLVGQLYGGSVSCTNPAGSNVYGRFDLAYNTALSRWLGVTAAQAQPVARTAIHHFYRAVSDDHFFTANAAERDNILATDPSYTYAGVSFYSYASPQAGTSPVYHFYSQARNKHYFTSVQAERDYLIANPGDFGYFGVSWYGQSGASGTAQPVFLFYRDIGEKFYWTVNTAERDYLLANDKSYRYVGISYYAWTTP